MFYERREDPKKRSHAEWAVRLALRTACPGSRSTVRDVADLDLEIVPKDLLKRCSTVEGDMIVIRSEYTGQVIASLPSEKVPRSEYYEYLVEHLSGTSNLSVDHEYQVSVRLS
ncbi:uncharacterized protein JCM15063_001794 [Sporobolomyces koalae]|uniref:uncharacterized protein n=1 Tax=Sporobolomyces koalae TaxID=500713 RepID=UPI00317B6250